MRWPYQVFLGRRHPWFEREASLDARIEKACVITHAAAKAPRGTVLNLFAIDGVSLFESHGRGFPIEMFGKIEEAWPLLVPIQLNQGSKVRIVFRFPSLFGRGAGVLLFGHRELQP